MPKLTIKAGSTSETVDVFIQDATATDGSGKTGLLFNTSGLTAYYNTRRGASTQITLATLASATAAYSSGGFKEIDETNQKGIYRLDIPDTLLATGNGRYCKIAIQGTGIVPCLLEIELTAIDNQNIINGGITALPNTACTTNASLITSGTSTDQLSVSTGNVKSILQSYASGQDPATLVLNAVASSYNTAGSIGSKINLVGASSDPLASAVPGSYSAGTAGYVLGHPDKTGYSLSSTGLDGVSTTIPSGFASTFTGRMNQIYNRLFGKAVKDVTGSPKTIRTYDPVSTSTVLTTQQITDDNLGNETTTVST